ncbi:iron complex outermembrane receptor protein [Bosea sp. BE125]|uniref:TonB-dependent receptor n=1 Tax=Bosea sp. BE125 TaxID=2817909 RepID=UPI0028568FFC|nr:TonB-dependent siderophore receptor [Bosea sp. BE125]MDR6872107.1 iron complex outermembrane receptor protein [Bosea sp. BE125]
MKLADVPPADVAAPRCGGGRYRYLTQGLASLLLGSVGLGLATAAAWAQERGGGALQLDEIVVDGPAKPGAVPPVFAGGQVAQGGRLGLLGNAETLKSPFNMTSYTAELIANLQASSVADALILDPSVRSSHPSGGIVESFNIRGFPVGEGNSGEIAFDGVFGVAPNYRVFTDYAERIEVLKGPAAALSGIAPNGGIGGVINIVPKRAEADLTRVGTEFSSKAYGGASFDIARRYGAAREFGVRVNGSLRGGDTAIDNQRNTTGIGSLALDYQGERFRSWVYVLAQRDSWDAPSRPYRMSPGIPVPNAPGGARNMIQPWEFSQVDDSSALIKNEYDLTDTVTLFANAGGSRTRVNRFFANSPLPTILNLNGDTTQAPQYFDMTIARQTYDAGFRARFDTGFVKHALTFQASYYREETDRALTTGRAFASNIYAPALTAPQFATRAPRIRLSDSDLTSVALADTLSVLDERVALTLGVRRQSVQSTNYATTNGAVTSSYDESATTPLVGLVLRPHQNLSLYANYVEGLSRGDIAPNTASNAGETFAPYRTKQYEAGAKLQYGSFGATLAGFQITKPSGELNGNLFVVGGEQRVRGLEFNVYGEVASGLRLLGGLALLDGKLTKTAVVANRGNDPIGVPSTQFNLGAEWDVPWFKGLTLTGTLVYTGKQYIDAANTQSLPDWARLDIGARYATEIAGRKTTFRASVQNVTAEKYWSSVASFGTFYLGAPRTFRLSMAVDL